MSVLIRPQADQTSGIFRTVDITPETARWQYVSFAVYHLTRGQTFRGAAEGRETALVVLYGIGRAELNGQPVGQIGERLSVFENKAPYALYLWAIACAFSQRCMRSPLLRFTCVTGVQL